MKDLIKFPSTFALDEAITQKHIALLRARLAAAESALRAIANIGASAAIDASLTMQQRRDSAWNALQQAKQIAAHGLQKI